MTDKQTFVAITGGLFSTIFGGALLIASVQLIYEATGHHFDGGDDGWGLLWIALSVLSGILGLLFCSKRASKRFPAALL